MDVTLVKVIDPAASGNQYIQPQPGKRFVAVQIKLTNTAADTQNGDPLNDVSIIDDQGQTYQVTFEEVADCQQIPSNLTLAPGDSALGCVSFEIPTAAKLAKFQYHPSSGFAKDVGRWSLA